MKFGKHIKEHTLPEWEGHMVNYKQVKNMIKDNAPIDQIKKQITDDVKKVSAKLRHFISNYKTKIDPLVLMLKKTKMTKENIPAFRKEIDRCAVILVHVDFYQTLNSSAVVKSIKKTNKNLGATSIRNDFFAELFKDPECFLLFDVHPLVVQLGAQYSRIIELEEGISDDDKKKGFSLETFARNTTKYWVRKENVLKLKCLLMRHLPLYQFQANALREDALIQSVYWDSEDLVLYKDRIMRVEGSKALRFRWYGEGTPKQVFLERKIHREGWTGETSIKERCDVDEKHIRTLLVGEKKEKEELRKKLLNEIGTEIFDLIDTKKLVPVCRTSYKRCAFQHKHNNSVRVSLDTDLCMSKEFGFVPHGGWKRPDETEFRLADNQKEYMFPFAVLEVKLSGAEAPAWLEDILAMNWIQLVPNFSKYIHGCYTHLKDKCRRHPYWIKYMGSFASRKLSPVPSFDDARLESKPDYVGKTIWEQQLEDEEELDTLGIGNRIAPKSVDDHLANLSRRQHVMVKDAKSPSDDSGLRERKDGKPQKKKKDGLSEPLLGDDTELKSVAVHGDPPPPPHDDSGCFPSCCVPKKSNDGKEEMFPTKLDPKIFFANERTFMKWMNASIWLTSLALGLRVINNDIANSASLAVFPVAFCILIYSLFQFLKREQTIRDAKAEIFSDKKGPVILVLALISCLVIVYALRFVPQPVPRLKMNEYLESRNCQPLYYDGFFQTLQRPSGLYITRTNDMYVPSLDSVIKITYDKSYWHGKQDIFTIACGQSECNYQAIAGTTSGTQDVIFLANAIDGYAGIVIAEPNGAVLATVNVSSFFGDVSTTSAYSFSGLAFVGQRKGANNENLYDLIIGTKPTILTPITVSEAGVVTSTNTSNEISALYHGAVDSSEYRFYNNIGDLHYEGGLLYVLFNRLRTVAVYDWDTHSTISHYPLSIPSDDLQGIARHGGRTIMASGAPALLWDLAMDKTGFLPCVPAP